MTYPDLEQGQHQIVGIVVVPADLDEDCNPSPAADADYTPHFACNICWKPHDECLKAPCPGPKIPDNIASLTEGD